MDAEISPPAGGSNTIEGDLNRGDPQTVKLAHLCHDEQKLTAVVKDEAPFTIALTSTSTPTPAPESESQAQPKPAMSAPEQPMNTFPCE